MADLSDVQNALASITGAALYPNGSAQPSNVGVGVVIRTGWPVPQQLKSIIQSGNAMISVYQFGNMGKNTTRFLGDSQPQTGIPDAQLTLTIRANTVTVGGMINPGEAPTLKVNYQPYSYAVQASDSLDTIATALAALIPGASANGTVITINGVFDIDAAISVPVVMQEEIGRQAQVFMLTAWTPSPESRDAICKAIELSFKKQPRILMPDNTLARLLYRGTIEQDSDQKQEIYRRNLLYEVEYALMAAETDHTVTNFGVTTTTSNGTSTTTNI